MKYIKLNKNWKAAPNQVEPLLSVKESVVELAFEPDPTFPHIDEGDKGVLEFSEVYAYKLSAIPQEDFQNNLFRIQNNQLPWGEFYELLDSGWKDNFPSDKIVVIDSLKDSKLKHFLFFLPNHIFECLASAYHFHFDYLIVEELEERYPKGYLNHYLAMFSTHFNQLNPDNYKVYTNLYIQLEGKKEFEGLKEEIKKIKANKDIDSYLKIANYSEIPNFGRKQLEEMLKVIETYDSRSKYA